MKRSISLAIGLLFPVLAFAQGLPQDDATTIRTLRYELGAALMQQSLSEANAAQVTSQRDWWIKCASDDGCRKWAFGVQK